MTIRKRLGLSPHLYCEPLRGAPGRRDEFDWRREVPARSAIALRERAIDLAFLTPIDYAKSSSLYYIVPKIVVASCSGDASVTLHFREGLHKIRTLAADPSSVSEIVLAKILLTEQFNLRPQIVPFQGGLEGALARADAALLVGDESLRTLHVHGNVLDVIEEWNDLTDLPYVHGFWCGWEHALTGEQISSLQQHCFDGVALLDEIAEAAPADHSLGAINAVEARDYLGKFVFEMSEEVEEGLKEFLRYAFYHGILPDVADLHYLEPSSTRDED